MFRHFIPFAFLHESPKDAFHHAMNRSEKDCSLSKYITVELAFQGGSEDKGRTDCDSPTYSNVPRLTSEVLKINI